MTKQSRMGNAISSTIVGKDISINLINSISKATEYHEK